MYDNNYVLFVCYIDRCEMNINSYNRRSIGCIASFVATLPQTHIKQSRWLFCLAFVLTFLCLNIVVHLILTFAWMPFTLILAIEAIVWFVVDVFLVVFFSSVFFSLGVFFACSSSKGCTANQHALHEHFMAWVHVFYSYIRWRPETKRNPRYVKVKQTSIEWLFNRYMLLLANYCHRF